MSGGTGNGGDPLPPVVLVTGEYPPDAGGVGDYTACLARALGETGMDVRVLTHAAGARDGDGEAGAEPRVLRGVRRWGLGMLGTLVRLAPRGGVVHLQYQPGAFGLRGEICLAPLALRLARPDVRVATTFHDARVPYLFPKAGPLRWQAVRLLAASSHAVLAADTRDLRALGHPPSPRHSWVPIGSNVPCAPPAGYDRAAFRAGLGLRETDLAVAYFGFLNQSKGLDTLLEAFRRIRGALPERSPRLLLLGGVVGASDATDRETAARVGGRLAALGAAVVRPGYLPRAELSAYLLAADVALLPYADGASWRRGSLLACAAHGLPIVTTAGGGGGGGVAGPGAPRLDEAAECVPVGDAVAAADGVVRVARDEALRARLQAGSRALAEATAWPSIAARHRAIYAQLQGRQSST